MSTPIQSRLKPGVAEALREHMEGFVDDWAGVLLGVDPSTFARRPAHSVYAARLTAVELALAELERYSKCLERQAREDGMTHSAIGVARGVSPQAVSARLKAS